MKPSRLYFLAPALLLFACEWNRTAPDDFTEIKRPGFPDDGTGGGLPKYERERIACVDRINAFRATEGLPPYQRWLDNEACNDGQAKSDYESGVAHSAFRNCPGTAQNECPGWPSVQSTITGCLQNMWDERLGPVSQQGHYLAMSNTRYTMVSCGFYEGPDGKVWAAQDFR